MQKTKYSLPFSKSTIEFSLPDRMQGTLALSQPAEPLTDAPGAIRAALAHPVRSVPLNELAAHGMRVCIVFTDSTRASPDHLLVPALLSELERAGVLDEDITLLCGTGMHRPSTQEERISKLGAEVVTRFRVIDSEPQNPAVLVDLGITPDGVPILLHRAVV